MRRDQNHGWRIPVQQLPWSLASDSGGCLRQGCGLRRELGQSAVRSVGVTSLQIGKGTDMGKLVRVSNDVDSGDLIAFNLQGGCLKNATLLDGDETGQSVDADDLG